MPIKRKKKPSKQTRTKNARPEWIGGIASLPTCVAGEDEPFLIDMLLWIEADGPLLGSNSGEPGEMLPAASESLRETLNMQPVGKASTPRRVRVASSELAEVLRAGHPTLDVVIAPTPELEKEFALIAKHLRKQMNHLNAELKSLGTSAPGNDELHPADALPKKAALRSDGEIDHDLREALEDEALDRVDYVDSEGSTLKQHRQRSPFERDLLALLALWNSSTSRTQWTEGAAAAGLTIAGRAPKTAQLLAFCETFVAEGAIVEFPSRSGRQVRYGVPQELAVGYLQDALAGGRLDELYHVAEQLPYPRNNFRSAYAVSDPSWLATMLRVALLRGDKEGAAAALEQRRDTIRGIGKRKALAQWLSDVLGPRPPKSWLNVLGSKDAAALGDYHLMSHVDYLLPPPRELVAGLPDSATRLAHHDAVVGGGDETLAQLPSKKGAPARMLSALCRGDYEAAADFGDEALASLGKRKHRMLRGTDGVVHMLVCLANASTRASAWDHLRLAANNARAAKLGHLEVYDALQLLVRGLSGEKDYLDQELEELSYFKEDRFSAAPWHVVLVFTIVHGFFEQPSNLISSLADACHARAMTGGYVGVAQEFDGAILLLEGDVAPPNTIAGRLRRKEPWELGLDSLALIAREEPKTEPEKEKAPFAEYVQWNLSFGFQDQRVDFVPRHVASARSTTGKEVSLRRLMDGSILGVSAADRKVLQHVEKVGRHGYKSDELVLPRNALIALVDHPHVARGSGAPLQLVRGQARLVVVSEGASIRISMTPERLLWDDFAFEEDSAARVVVYARGDDIERIAGALGGSPLDVPSSEAARLSEILAGLSARVSISANADVEVAGDEVAPESTPVVRLEWDGTQMSAALFVAPLGLDGPHVRLGKGSRMLVTTIEGRVLRTTRSLEEETARFAKLADTCPALALLLEGEATLELEDSLQLVGELDAAGDSVLVTWPKGQKLAPAKRVGISNMRVGASESSKWLELDVAVVVDAETVLSFRELLAGRGKRFVRLGADQFVAISDELRKRLDAFEGITKMTKSKATASLATLPLIVELAAGAKFDLDEKAAERQAAFERSLALRPRVPKVFRAELRDYQLDGFRWLAQLAEAGLGACLADDMGLGKTIQTLALLCLRRKKGPALVVAPSSVASNWISEARRFAPSLKVALLADSEDRAETLNELGAADVLVCSYGLLQREGERLAEVDFDSVVFDEAHMLKNSQTKRSKASKALSAHFRLSLTGTPIENHLGELWSLMESTVPGLLGPKKRFEKHYALPIAAGERQRSDELRALLRPFMLRRTKAQVLDELPPRTEVTLVVTPNERERAFYEAVRLRAVEQLAPSDDATPNRITILAEITRLRQAAVDPRLLNDEAPAGSKVAELMDRVLALRAEGHRVLVFSQFLGALALVRSALEASKVSYQTLDGSVTTAERARRIDAFQAGEGDVFVISLRAGGVGVNLTGADYVIHLDPWWNPAVEEQATARSHRIGQTRPVTVYRMISENTIEEKILALHQKKRALAEDLLEGIDEAKKLDLAQLRALLS